MVDEQQVVTPGALLRTAREASGYLQTDVAKQLCVSVRVISEIENNEYGHFAAETYLIGHLRSYARLLQVDEGIVCEAYKNLGVTFKKNSQADLSSPSVAFSVYKMHSPRKKTISGIVIVSIALSILLVGGGLWQKQRVKVNPPGTKTASSKESEVFAPEALLSEKPLTGRSSVIPAVMSSTKKNSQSAQLAKPSVVFDRQTPLEQWQPTEEVLRHDAKKHSSSSLSKTFPSSPEDSEGSSFQVLASSDQNVTPDDLITAVKE